MSESTSAPAAPAAAPIPDGAPAVSPPPISQPAITVSEAGRLLSQQRRAAQQAEGGEAKAPPPAAAPPTHKPSPNEVAAAAKAAAAQPTSPTSPTSPPAEAPALTALERALGVPADVAVEVAAPAAETAVEIEGRRYTQAQLREAVLKSADYTQKTQELSQQRQALAAQQEALATVLPYIQPELAKLAELIQGTSRPDPALLETDPQRYLRERAAYEQAIEEQGRLGGLTQIQQQAQQRAMEQAVAASNEVLAKEFPFWSDPAERAQAQQQIVAWATDKGGFSRDELRGLVSAHHLKTMMKAMAYDRMVARSTTTAPAAQLQAPVRGAAPPPAPTQRVQAAMESFESKPNIRTGAALLAARRGANGSTRV